jgi:hypothetical protein
MRIKARLGTLALLAGVLFGSSVTVASGSAGASGPSQSAQNAFVKKIDASEITGIPDKVIATLGVTICQLLANGKSVTFVNNTLTVPTKATGGSSFPQQFVTLMLVQASKMLCPSEEAKVQSFVSTGKKAPTLVTDQTLSGLLPPESDKCTASKKITSPPGLVGLVDYEQCSLPNLGSQSYVFGYIFDNASDYATSLKAYNKFKDIVPTTAGVGCPTPNTSDNGAVSWSSSAFPARSGQVIECTYEASSATAKTNNDPNYVWTVPSKFVIISALADPGSTMKHLDQWWTKYSLT